MPFLTNDPLPQCLQTSSDIALSPPIGNRRGCGRYLLEVKCLKVRGPVDWEQAGAGGEQDLAVRQPGRRSVGEVIVLAADLGEVRADRPSTAAGVIDRGARHGTGRDAAERHDRAVGP